MKNFLSDSIKVRTRKIIALVTLIFLGLFSLIGCGGGTNGGEPGTLQFSAASYSGNENAGDVTITVTRTGGSTGAVAVDVNDAKNGTATSGTDYTAITSTTLSWADGDQNAKTFIISVIDDTVIENDETINLTLANITGGATLGNQNSTTLTINNDDVGDPGVLQFNTSSYSGNEDAGEITITVTRTGGSDGAVMVDISDANSGSASSGTDYSLISTTTLSWTDGDLNDKTFAIPIIADGTLESDETIELVLSNVVGASLGSTTSATVTILNDDAAVPGTLQFSPANYDVEENGSGIATISVIRSGGETGSVTVDYATSDNTAVAGDDYVATSGTLTWPDNVSGTETFTVAIINDTLVENDEVANIILSNPTGGATLGVSTANLNIISDDAYGSILFSATSYNVDETDGAAANVISLLRENGSSGSVTVDVSDLGNGSASGSGIDYTYTSPTTVNWDDGDTSDKSILITLIDDLVVEGNETVNLSLGNITGGASIGTPNTATVNIADNDTAPSAGKLQFDATEYAVTENGVTATITVNRVDGTSGAVDVSYATSDNTATAGNDYTATSGTFHWANGVSGAQTFTVPINNDSEIEGDETINLTLSNPTGGALLGIPSSATLTISDNDTNLTMNIGDGSYWVAFQDGPNGEWREWSPTSGNTYDFPVTDANGRYGVAFHRPETDDFFTVEKTYVIQATVQEMSSLNAFRNTPYTVSGMLSNYTTNMDSVDVAMHTRLDGDELAADPFIYSLNRVPAGTRDLIAYEWAAASEETGNFVIHRDLNVVGDLLNQNIDFTADGQLLTFAAKSFSGSKVNQLLEVYYSTANGTSFNIVSETYDGSTAASYPYLTNASLIQPGDIYSFQITNSAFSKYRVRNKLATSNPGNQSLALGSLSNLTGTAANATQTSGLNYEPNPNSIGGDAKFRGFQIDLDQTAAGIDGGAHWKIIISKKWLDTSTTYTYPALSSIGGYDDDWNMSNNTLTTSTVTSVTTNSDTKLALITRKTIGPNNTQNLNSETWVVAKKLAQNSSLKADFSFQYSGFIWQ